MSQRGVQHVQGRTWFEECQIHTRVAEGDV